MPNHSEASEGCKEQEWNLIRTTLNKMGLAVFKWNHTKALELEEKLRPSLGRGNKDLN